MPLCQYLQLFWFISSNTPLSEKKDAIKNVYRYGGGVCLRTNSLGVVVMVNIVPIFIIFIFATKGTWRANFPKQRFNFLCIKQRHVFFFSPSTILNVKPGSYLKIPSIWSWLNEGTFICMTKNVTTLYVIKYRDVQHY